MKLWIARDKDGRLYLYECMPIRQDLAGYFDCEEGENADLSWLKHLFPEITWENSPQQVELKLLKNENEQK